MPAYKQYSFEVSVTRYDPSMTCRLANEGPVDCHRNCDCSITQQIESSQPPAPLQAVPPSASSNQPSAAHSKHQRRTSLARNRTRSALQRKLLESALEQRPRLADCLAAEDSDQLNLSSSHSKQACLVLLLLRKQEDCSAEEEDSVRLLCPPLDQQLEADSLVKQRSQLRRRSILRNLRRLRWELEADCSDSSRRQRRQTRLGSRQQLEDCLANHHSNLRQLQEDFLSVRGELLVSIDCFVLGFRDADQR